jgi:CheY-like chemotaxis protein
MPHILVVEDDSVTQNLMVAILRRYSHHATIASDGLEALNLLQAGARFDVIISDIKMPHLDGIALFEQIRQSYPHIPFVIMTVSTERRRDLLQMGIDAFVEKPFTGQTLQDALDSLLLPSSGD